MVIIIGACLVLVLITLLVVARRFGNRFRRDVAQYVYFDAAAECSPIEESDMLHLPAPVQRYLRYTGMIGRPKIQNFKVIIQGELREQGRDWFPFTSTQYNLINAPVRLFFLKAMMKGLPVTGYHAYQNGRAVMDIRIMSLFPIVHEDGEAMNVSETVTWLNDVCIMAPGALIGPQFTWEAVDELYAKVWFTCRDITVGATLYFNEKGQLINFHSDDRYAVSKGKQFRFWTPVGEYRNMNGYQLGTLGEAIWDFPEGQFTYGKFRLQEIVYNVKP